MIDPTGERIIVPVAIVTGTLRVKGGSPDVDLVASAVEVLEAAAKRGGAPSAVSPFPLAMTAELALRALTRGIPLFAGPGKSGAYAALHGENGFQSLETAWAIDLVQGLCHPFSWVAQHERREVHPSDVPVAPAKDATTAPALLRTTDLRRLVRNRSPPKERMDSEEYRSWKQWLEDRADRVEALALARTMEVAIPIRHHEKGMAERWLVGADPPPTMMRVLRGSVQQLLELKINTKDLRLGFSRTPALQLLESVDDFWERARWNTFKTVSKETRQLLATRGLALVSEWMSSWVDPTEAASDASELGVCIGPAMDQATAFRRLCLSTRKQLVVLTSFLNPKHVAWVGSLLSALPDGSEALLLYGHANDEDARAREETALTYQRLLSARVRSQVRVLVKPTTMRSHEKLVVNDHSLFMLGSWNLGSSFEHAPYLEGTILGRSKALSADLLSLLIEEADEQSKRILQSTLGSLTETQGSVGEPVSERLRALSSLFQSILDEGVHEARDWRKVREQLTALRDVLWTHFRSPKLELVKGEDIRDVLIEQVASAGHAIAIATDRLNESGLDASLVGELRLDDLRVRILWGLENPAWKTDDKDTLEELGAAREVLHRLLEARPDNLRSSESPMGNHSKFVVVDESRLLIGSDNFLAHGRERGSESSRELALLIEHPLLARRALAAALLARPELWFPHDLKARDKPWEIYELVRRQVEGLASDSALRDPHRVALVEFAAESTFREFTADGAIKTDLAGHPISTNPSLAGRWDAVMRAFGKGRSSMYFEELAKQSHENGFIQLVWEADRTYSLHPLGSQPPLAPRASVVRDPESLGAGVQAFCHSTEGLESRPFDPVEESEVMTATRRAHGWFDPQRWGMDESRFLDFLVESGRIARLPAGKCRRIKESERQELRKQRWSGALVGEPNAVCRECHRPFHHPHHLPRESGRTLPKSVCLECRARLGATASADTLRREFADPSVVRDPLEIRTLRQSNPEPLAEGERVASSCSVCGTTLMLPFRPDGVRPIYCPRHRPHLKREPNAAVSEAPREFHDATCSTCGGSIKVPFIPAPGRPVYCRLHLPPKKRMP